MSDASLRQRRWTTKLDKNIFSTPETAESLEKRVQDSYRGIGVKPKKTKGIFTRLRMVKGIPLVQIDGEWYFLQTSEAVKPGRLFEGEIRDNKEVGFIGTIKGWQKLPLHDNPSSAAFYKEEEITLKEALRLKKGHDPVYHGNTDNFVSGRLLRKPNRIKTTKKGPEIIGTAIISEQDYRALDAYLTRKKHPIAKNLKKILGLEEEVKKPVHEKAEEKIPKQGWDGVNGYSKEKRGYDAWISIPENEPSRKRSNSKEVREAFDAQEDFTRLDEIGPGWKDTLEGITNGEFRLKNVSLRIDNTEYFRTGEKTMVCVAYASDPVKGEKPNGFYVILSPTAPEVKEIVRSGRRDARTGLFIRELEKARPMNLAYWPAVVEGEVMERDKWRKGENNSLVLEGKVAVPKSTAFYMEKAKLIGVAGMSNQMWRKMLVKKTAADILDKYTSRRVEQGLSSKGIMDSAMQAYRNSPAIQAVAKGEYSFANSVLADIKERGVSTFTERRLER